MQSYIRASVRNLEAYVPGEQPREGGVVKLNTNENPYPPSPGVAAALRGLDPARLRLYPNPVAGPLRDKVAELYGCRSGNVFVGNGSDEILALCTRAFVDDDGTIGWFEPSYSLYPVLTAIRDIESRPVPLGPDFEWSMPQGYGCSLFFLTRPNAPTGILYPRPVVRSFCESFPGVVVIDEAYAEFACDDCMDMALEFDNVLVLRTLSKSHSLAGIRLGYAVGQAALIEALFKIKDSYNVDTLSQSAGLAALSDTAHTAANTARIQATRARLSAELANLGHRVYPSEANFVWARPARLTAAEVYAGLKQQGILIRHFSGGRTDGFVRISVGTDEEIDKLLDALAAIEGRDTSGGETV